MRAGSFATGSSVSRETPSIVTTTPCIAASARTKHWTRTFDTVFTTPEGDEARLSSPSRTLAVSLRKTSRTMDAERSKPTREPTGDDSTRGVLPSSFIGTAECTRSSASKDALNSIFTTRFKFVRCVTAHAPTGHYHFR
ncbi:hypothetical protein PYCCODRAFT_1510402 [Trametes coccinea BRFM310]|uniref:Uncharacterized protein n=1 Tax=Trametes coccinea (strain BRFM310) TaxID=1353009 RepID=A0A1Y2IKJ6_TRAC3|nr:hypothetical protein PYCCODRAFT_1510402 [Trametes coccinea BRFM310]